MLMFVLLPFIVWMFDTSVSSEISFERFASVFTAASAWCRAGCQAGGAGADLGLPAPLHRRRAPSVDGHATHSVSKEQGRSSAVVTLAPACCSPWLLGAKLFGLY
jgi:succinate dehydrogenase / fumarate reductase cytochrome b subunit